MVVSPTRVCCRTIALGATLAVVSSCSNSFKADSPSGGTAGVGSDAQGGAPEGGKGGASSGGSGAGQSHGGTGTGGSNGGTGADGGMAGETSQAGTGGQGAPTYRDVVLAEGPLVYWRMGIADGPSIPDETGGGNHLILQGDGHVLGEVGAIENDEDTAIGFDGMSSFAIATNPRVLDFNERAPFTLECWARRVTGGMSYFQHLFSNMVGSPGARDGYILYLLPEPAGTDNQRTAFEYDRTGVEVGLWGAVPDEATWAYYVVTFDGTMMTLYVNGTFEQSEAIDGAFAPRTGPFAVGRAANDDRDYFKGTLDEMAVYAHALDIGAIAEHFARGVH